VSLGVAKSPNETRSLVGLAAEYKPSKSGDLEGGGPYSATQKSIAYDKGSCGDLPSFLSQYSHRDGTTKGGSIHPKGQLKGKKVVTPSHKVAMFS